MTQQSRGEDFFVPPAPAEAVRDVSEVRPLRLHDPGESDQIAENVAQAFDAFLAGRGLAPSTEAEYRVTQRRLIEWMTESDFGGFGVGKHRSTTPMLDLTGLVGRDIADFLEWAEKRTKGKNPGRVVNKHRQHLSVLLRWTEERQPAGGAWSMPRLPPKRRQRSRANVVCFTRQEIGLLYRRCELISDPGGWDREGLGPYFQQWQALIVLGVTYGLDTGTLFRYGRSTAPLCWSNVYWQSIPPTRRTIEGLPTEPVGWLGYRRQKSKKGLELPISASVAWQLRRLAGYRPRLSPEDPILICGPVSKGTRPAERFRCLAEACGIPESVDINTGRRIPWTLKHLRKTCATWHENHLPGSSSGILGHRPQNAESITANHYIDTAPLAARAILTTPMPEEFPV